MAASEQRYGFGENWQKFLDDFSEDRAVQAQRNLLKSLCRPDLKGATFLDIGSGSGLHSLAAWRSGADRIFSFDYDRNSVEATKSLWHMVGEPANWHVEQGSVLDRKYVESLGSFDFVYSWGVLHHTGDMWGAIRNAAIPVAAKGVFFIALYSDTVYRDASLFGSPTPEKWLKIKKAYNSASNFKKRLMEWRHYLGLYGVLSHPRSCLSRMRESRRASKTYMASRGMEYWTDIRDWLGGWPMEFVKEKDCIQFCANELGLETVALNTGEGNTEFVFRPKGCGNYWDSIVAGRTRRTVVPPFEADAGHAWKIHVPDLAAVSDAGGTGRSSLRLVEDGVFLGFAHALHVGICKFGEGRYSHWGDDVYFSTSDNSNPNTNGRKYEILL